MKSDLKLIEQEISEALSDEERLLVLLERCLAHYRTHPKKAREWAKNAIRLAKKLGRTLDVGRGHVRLGSAEFQLCEFESAIKSLRAAIDIFDSIDPNSTMK